MDRRPNVDIVPAVSARPGGSTRADPCALVVFGATGDLGRREVLPALFELFSGGLLPERWALLAVARQSWNDDRFRSFAREGVAEHCRADRRRWDEFARRLTFHSMDAGERGAFDGLRPVLNALDTEHGLGGNALFHLAVPPRIFEPIVGGLEAAGLTRSEAGWRRLLVEKPFGTDRASAARLNARLLEAFDEHDLYRIDHFLGKESVQNMLVFRFANPGFEAIWNRDHIEQVQITVAEDIGIGSRAAFYESTGVVRDMVQNHLLQLLSLVAMEPPVSLTADALRDETVKVLDAVALRGLTVRDDAVLGQYGEGVVDGERVPAYRDEPDVSPQSTTATYAAVELGVRNWRWAGVPFYLRTGKRLGRKLTQVVLQFRPVPAIPNLGSADETRRHWLAFRLQPDEGITRVFSAKRPGPDLELTDVAMDFTYARSFGLTDPPRAYAWLFLDAMQGDPMLFARADWVDRAWAIVDPLVAAAAEAGAPRLYPAGAWGPAAADSLLERSGHHWIAADVR